MDRRRQHVRPPVRRPAQTTSRQPIRRPAQRPPVMARRKHRRRRKPRRDWTLAILDFFANIGRGIRRGYLWFRSTRYFGIVSSFMVIFFIISVSVLVLFVATRPNALEIQLDDASIGAVRMDGGRQVTLEYITRHAIARIETQLGSHINLISDVQARPIRISSGNAVYTFDNLVTAMVDALDYYIWGATIIVDGNEAAMLPSLAVAETLLSDIASSLRPGGGAMSFHNVFAENVEIVQGYVSNSELMTADAARTTLTTPREVPGIHIVRSGDTFWGIEQATGMSINDLIEANPDVNPSSLQVGQRIVVVRNVAVLTLHE